MKIFCGGKKMYHDEFKLKYTSIPFATFLRNHKKRRRKKDLITLLHMYREIEILVVVIVPPYVIHNTTIFRNYDFKHFCICFDMEIIENQEIKQNVENGCLVMNFIIEKNNVVTGAGCLWNCGYLHGLPHFPLTKSKAF